MKKPAIPLNERERMQALDHLNILETPIQEPFERITRLAKSFFNVPIVAFTLVDSEIQWFKSIQGLDVCETSREVSFCGHTINQDDVMIVNDALLDKRFSDNPLVIGPPNIRFYAGYPVRTDKGEKIGALCLIDQQPRSFTDKDILALKDMAALVESEVSNNKNYFNQLKLIKELDQIKKSSFIDGLTRLVNRSGIENYLENQIKSAIEHKKDFGIALIDIDNFKAINDTHGHCAGDEVLRQIAKRLLIGYRDTDTIGRWGGEEFLVICDLDKPHQIYNIAERARVTITEEPMIVDNQELSVSVTTGVACFLWQQPCDLTSLISSADKALYDGKKKGKNIVIEYQDVNTR